MNHSTEESPARVLSDYDERALARLRSAIRVTPDDGCWVWTRRVNRKGYGSFSYMGKERPVHRVSYELFVGPIPEGLQLDHLCRVRACVNPAHLEPVTCRENLMRGETLAARQAGMTSCHRGHPFTPENTYIRPSSNIRECRACWRMRHPVSVDERPTAIFCAAGLHRWDEQRPLVSKKGRECSPCRNARKRERRRQDREMAAGRIDR